MRARLALAVVLAVGWVVGAAPTAHADGGDPIGAFDFVSRDGPSKFGPADARRWHVAGWGAHADAPCKPIEIHLYLDGAPIDGPNTGMPRPDVEALYPFAG